MFGVGGVMVLTWSGVDRGFVLQAGQTRDYGFHFFIAGNNK